MFKLFPPPIVLILVPTIMNYRFSYVNTSFKKGKKMLIECHKTVACTTFCKVAIVIIGMGYSVLCTPFSHPCVEMLRVIKLMRAFFHLYTFLFCVLHFHRLHQLACVLSPLHISTFAFLHISVFFFEGHVQFHILCLPLLCHSLFYLVSELFYFPHVECFFLVLYIYHRCNWDY